MSGYYRQMQQRHNEARSALNERLAREEMGDDAYEASASHGDDGRFRIVGIALMLAFAAVVLAVTLLGY